MFNFGIISILSLILVYQNIILLNEESLILICFIVFCCLVFNNIKISISSDFKTQTTTIEKSLVQSLDQVLTNLIEAIKIQRKYKILSFTFKDLSKHLIKFNSIICNKLPYYLISKSEIIYPKKLIFTQRLEQQAMKLLGILLNQN